MAWRLHDEIVLTTTNGLYSFTFSPQIQEILDAFRKYEQNREISLVNVIDFLDDFLAIDEVANYIKNNGFAIENEEDLDNFNVNQYVFYNGKFYYKFGEGNYIAYILKFFYDILYNLTVGVISEDEIFYVDYED